MNLVLLKRPSALIPISMSVAALGVILVCAARFGVEPQPDEGAAAHIWQLLMAGQLPVIAFFAIKWIRTDVRQGLLVLGLQFVAALSAGFPVGGSIGKWQVIKFTFSTFTMGRVPVLVFQNRKSCSSSSSSFILELPSHSQIVPRGTIWL